MTGGEPLLQMEFVTELFEEARRRDIHTCLDTSGVTFRDANTAYLEQLDRLLASTCLVMLDLKQIDDEKHRLLTGRPNRNILQFAEYLLSLIHIWKPQFVPSLQHSRVPSD